MVCAYSRLSFCFAASAAVLARASEPIADLDDMALPDVDSMLSEATETVSSLAKTADQMEQALSRKQLRHQAHLDKLRAGYTSRLDMKDQFNKALAADNEKMQRETTSLEAGNKAIRKDAKALRARNEGLRSFFAQVAPKIHAAKQFLLAGKNASEAPLHTKDIHLLKESSSSPSLEKFLEAVRGDGGDDQRQSLMQLTGRSTTRRTGATAAMKSRAHEAAESTAEGIVQELSQQVEKIGQAQEEGDLQMKATFIANFEARQLKTDQLLEEQRKLNASKTDATGERADLLSAQKALQAVNEDLVRRVKGISAFAMSSSKYVVSRLDMASIAMGDNSTGTRGKALMQSAAKTSSQTGDLAWF